MMKLHTFLMRLYENRKDLSVALNNLAEMYDCLDGVVSTSYKSDTEIS